MLLWSVTSSWWNLARRPVFSRSSTAALPRTTSRARDENKLSCFTNKNKFASILFRTETMFHRIVNSHQIRSDSSLAIICIWHIGLHPYFTTQWEIWWTSLWSPSHFSDLFPGTQYNVVNLEVQFNFSFFKLHSGAKFNSWPGHVTLMGVKYASHMMINKVMTEELHDIKMYWEFRYYRVNGMHGIVRIMSLFFFNHMTAGGVTTVWYGSRVTNLLRFGRVFRFSSRPHATEGFAWPLQQMVLSVWISTEYSSIVLLLIYSIVSWGMSSCDIRLVFGMIRLRLCVVVEFSDEDLSSVSMWVTSTLSLHRHIPRLHMESFWMISIVLTGMTNLYVFVDVIRELTLHHVSGTNTGALPSC